MKLQIAGFSHSCRVVHRQVTVTTKLKPQNHQTKVLCAFVENVPRQIKAIIEAKAVLNEPSKAAPTKSMQKKETTLAIRDLFP